MTEYNVFSARRLPDGDFALAGVFSGDPVVEGQRISATTSNGKVLFKIVNIGIVDPNLVEETKRQGIVVKLVSGDIVAGSELEGATFQTE